MNENHFFAKHAFWIFVPVNTIASIFLYLFDISFANLLVFGKLNSFLIFYAGFIFVQFIVTPIVTYSYMKKVKHGMSYFLSGDSTIAERTELVRGLNKFPIQKLCDTTLLFFFGNITILLGLGKWINLSFRNLLPVALGSWFIAYFCGIVAFGNAIKVCSNFASKVVAQGIDEEVVKSEKYFGFDDFQIGLWFVINSIIISGLLFVCCTFVSGNQLVKMILCLVFVIILVTVGCVMYSKYLKRYLRKVQKSLEVIDLDNIGDFNYSNNIKEFDMMNKYAYSIFLTSKIIEMFLEMIENTKSLTMDFVGQSEGLSSTSDRARGVIENQKKDIESVRLSITTTAMLSSDILKRVAEVNTVALKTDSDVDYCMEAINSNISKMKEIVSTNRSTIQGIQALAHKITTVREIINLIDTVAEQTKIIAFNTEIEAESIKSNDEVFFNLATEIRSLADSTMDLTRQIRDQIKEIQLSTSSLVVTGENCTKKITVGNSFMLELERRFADVKYETQKTTEYTSKINTNLNKDTDVFPNVLGKLNDIDSGLKKISLNTSKVSSILEDLSENTKTIENISFGNI